MIVDAGLVVDTPPSDGFIRPRRRNVLGSARVGESAGVVILNKCLCVPSEGLKRQIAEAVAAVVIHVNEWRRLGDLELRTMIANPEHRLRDGIEHSEIPVGRARARRALRYALRNSLQANVVRLQVAQRSCRGGNILEKLEVPLGRLERC